MSSGAWVQQRRGVSPGAGRPILATLESMVMMSGGYGVQGPVPPEQVRELPLEGVAFLLLEYFARTGIDQIHTKDVMNLARQGYQADAELCDKVSDALACGSRVVAFWGRQDSAMHGA